MRPADGFVAEDLAGAAAEAARHAYAPYSKFAVGAALLTRTGKLALGCNIENASFGLTMCAERVALGRAVSDGTREFVALALCTPGGILPCGACRQVLYEFNPQLEILAVNSQLDVISRHVLEELLPGGFDQSSLEI